MMEIRQYLLSVICISLLCALIPVFSGAGIKSILRLICGIFLTISVIAPIMRIDPERMAESIFPDMATQSVAEQGKHQAINAMAAIIKQETEAYILDKARLLGLELKVTVELESDELPIPASVILVGTASREQKVKLEEILSTDLGIPKEEQQWISS